MTVKHLLADCEAKGIHLQPDGRGGVTVDAPRGVLTHDVLARVKDHKSELLAALTELDGTTMSTGTDSGDFQSRDSDLGDGQGLGHRSPEYRLQYSQKAPTDQDDSNFGNIESAFGKSENTEPWEEGRAPPLPCSTCGSLVTWENALGQSRCIACDPPTTAIRAMERAERIRQRLNVPSPAGAADHLTEMRRLTDLYSKRSRGGEKR